MKCGPLDNTVYRKCPMALKPRAVEQYFESGPQAVYGSFHVRPTHFFTSCLSIFIKIAVLVGPNEQ